MAIKAIGFDLGHTLLFSTNPLNWSTLYRPALAEVLARCSLSPAEERLRAAEGVLTHYNTRVNPREKEVAATQIWAEICAAWGLPPDCIEPAKEAFFSFCMADEQPYPEAEPVLRTLRAAGVGMGVLTDIAYGMENHYSLGGLASLRPYLDVCLTSLDVGYRKPHPAGYRLLLSHFAVKPGEMLFVGDEQKDIAGANGLGIPSVLVNRGETALKYGQTHTIGSLEELPGLVHSLQ